MDLEKFKTPIIKPMKIELVLDQQRKIKQQSGVFGRRIFRAFHFVAGVHAIGTYAIFTFVPTSPCFLRRIWFQNFVITTATGIFAGGRFCGVSLQQTPGSSPMVDSINANEFSLPLGVGFADASTSAISMNIRQSTEYWNERLWNANEVPMVPGSPYQFVVSYYQANGAADTSNTNFEFEIDQLQ